MSAVLRLELLPITAQRYELRLELDDDQFQRPPQTFPCGPFDADALRALLVSDPDAYGAALCHALFADPQAVAAYRELRTAALNRNNSRAVSVQLIVPPALQGLRWELLRDPVSRQPVGCDANAWWSRLLPVDHTIPLPPAPTSVRRVLLAVADPVDAATYRLPGIDMEYIDLLRRVLADWEPMVISASLDDMRNQLSDGYDMLVLVAHGTLVEGQPWLFLVDEQQRVARRSGTDLVDMLKSLGERCPRLVVLISCAGAGDDDRQPLTALGPLLAQSGSPAVIAAYGNLSLATAARSLPILFGELRLHGQIDRALNAARLAARLGGRSDWWALTLFSRLRDGRLWVSADYSSDSRQPSFAPAASGNLQSSTQMLISYSAYATQGGTATVYNTTNIYSLPRQWQRPSPPRLTRQYLVERHADIEHLRQLLQEHGRAAITPTVGIYGMAGVGKTVLAQLLAHRLNNEYPDGVIWERLGPNVKTADQVQDILNRWARHAIGIEFNPNQPMRFEPDAVRTLLAEHPRLLIILDDVWSKAALDPLLDVIPAGAHLLITTRSRQLVIQMGFQEHQLDVLKDDEARELVARRLGWGNAIPDHARQWVDELITAVGRHTLALDVALGLLRLRGNPTVWASEAHHIITAIKSGADFADLNLGADDREHHVELVLRYSYDHALDEEGRRCFRLLGAFASSADFSTAQVAALWQCDEKTARSRLNDFVNRSLLNRSDSDDDHWRQHPLLSGYARALLRRSGEYEAAAARHAQIFATAMEEADDRQQFYTMKPYIPQLRHAFSWAIVNDLEQALDLIGHCARLQQTFELGTEHLQWCEQALQQAQRRGTANIIARAQGSLGNALQHAATLPGEDRAARLRAALAAYDEALRVITAETVPLAYAQTQNNRGNCLQALATLPGEDRAARLHAALAAYDEALRVITAETVPLAYAGTQTNRGNCLQALATLPGEDRAARLRAALAAYDEALCVITAETVPLDYATTQNNRGACLQDLATLPGEDRAARLHAALAAYDEALRVITAETVPLAYAQTQNNRGNCLQALATLPGEDRAARLRAALAAYDEALRFRTAETVPLDYAQTQNNRGNCLQALATLPGEDRAARRRAALAAYDEALRVITAETVPLDYAGTQTNRGNCLQALATLPGEDRAARLHAALAAYDEALRFRTAETVPLDYAQTQNNRGNCLQALATLPGEDRAARLHAALAAYWDAVQIFDRYQHAEYLAITRRTLQQMRTQLGDEFVKLWEALFAEPLPDWLADPFTSLLNTLLQVRDSQELVAFWQQVPTALEDGLIAAGEALLEQARQHGDEQLVQALGQRLEGVRQLHGMQRFVSMQVRLLSLLRDALPPELQARLVEAGATDESTLPAVLMHHPTLAQEVQAFLMTNPHLVEQALAQEPELAQAFNDALTAHPEILLNSLLNALLQVRDSRELVAFWQQVPTALEDGLIAAGEALLEQARQNGDEQLVQTLSWRLEGFRQLCAAQANSRQRRFQAALQAYVAAVQAAEADGANVARWQAVVSAGEALCDPDLRGLEGVDWLALHAHLAHCYHQLGNALFAGEDTAAALAAYERAVELQPDEAIYWCNRTAALIALGRLSEAAAALERARALDPTAPRLAELEAQLAQAHRQASSATEATDE
ncbi:MAG: hypothetical protein KatS3mg056_1605 [Chloroflexus sp.]|nr:MAG: hypothetical protein KatS3mg056_1605 [Chloroflexus sp.]